MNTSKNAVLGCIATLLLPLSANADVLLTDFESGYPAGFFAYSGGGGLAAPLFTVGDADALARPGQVGDNTFLNFFFDFTGDFGGFGIDLGIGGPDDWTSFNTFSFWMLGQGSGASLQFELLDNRSDPSIDTAERFDIGLTDDVAGWSEISVEFDDLTRATDFQPGGAPNDGLGLNEVWGFAIVLDGNSGALGFDDFRVHQVPEPATIALFGLGLAGMLIGRRRKTQ